GGGRVGVSPHQLVDAVGVDANAVLLAAALEAEAAQLPVLAHAVDGREAAVQPVLRLLRGQNVATVAVRRLRRRQFAVHAFSFLVSWASSKPVLSSRSRAFRY